MKILYDASQLIDSQFTGNFEEFTKVTLSQLQSQIDLKKDPLLQTLTLLQAKQIVADSSVEALLPTIEKQDKNFAMYLALVKATYAGICTELYSALERKHKDHVRDVRKLSTNLEYSDSENHKLLASRQDLELIVKEHDEAKLKMAEKVEYEREKMTEELGRLQSEVTSKY